MVKGIRLAIVAIMALGVLAAPSVAFACAGVGMPGGDTAEPVGTMRPADEPNIVPVPVETAAIEVAQPQERSENTTLFRLTREDQAEASFALATLAPLIFAMLTIGAYAISRRR